MAKRTKEKLKKALEIAAEVLGIVLSLIPFIIGRRKK
jgi:hypothetical protein